MSSPQISLNKLIKSFAYMLSGAFGVLLFGMGTTLMLAYFLSPRDLGILMTAEAFVGLFEFFFEFGMKNSIVKLSSEYPESKGGFQKGLNIVVGNALLLKGLITIPLGLAIYFIGLWSGLEEFTMHILLCYIFIFTFNFFSRVFGITRTALGKFKLVAGINTTVMALRLVLIFVVLKYLGGLELLAYSFIGLSMFRFFFSFVMTAPFIQPKIDFSQIGKLIDQSLKYGVFDFLEELQTRIDRVMINFFAGPASVAFYAIPAKLNRITTTMHGTVNQVFLPTMHHSEEEAFRPLCKNLSRFFAIMGAFVFLGYFYFSGDILLMLYGGKYSEALSIIELFVYVNFLWFLNNIPSLILATEGAHKKRLNTQIAFTVINIILNIVLIPNYGIVGAVYATLASNIFKFIVITLFSYKYLDNLRIIMTAVLPMIMVWYMPWYFAVPIFIAYLFIARLVTIEELCRLQEIIKSSDKNPFGKNL